MKRSVRALITSAEFSLRPHPEHQALATELIKAVQRLKHLALIGTAMNKIIRSDMIPVFWPQPDTESGIQPRSVLLRLLYGSTRILSETLTADTRVRDLPGPRPGDLIVIGADSFAIQGESTSDRDRLIWTPELVLA